MHVTFFRFNDNYTRVIDAAIIEKIYIYINSVIWIIRSLIMRGLVLIVYAREEKE